MKVIGKDRTSCDVCNPIDEILARLDALERRASAIVAKVQGIAPDGEGNVTLPSSSSDTDPLHGRVDAFAMSSEVKEAADDAHAYAASIADDVVVINSEIDALNQAVAALQPAEIEAIKVAVETLQTTVATLESTVATLNDSVAGKVSKSGDTMSGTLTTAMHGWVNRNFKSLDYDATNPRGGDERTINVGAYDKNGKLTTALTTINATNFMRTYLSSYAYKADGTQVHSFIDIYARRNGDRYVSVPSWLPGTNDNSDKILTIKMANSLPSLVHTTGTEDISGLKKFLSGITLKNDDTKSITFSKADGMEVGYLSMSSNGDMWIKSSSGKITFESPNGTVNAPATPSGASGTEIATANWVLARINELATKNGLNGL